MSAADEDTELRDLLVQTLDKNGVLGKIKAELRASIFLALEAQEQNKTQNPLKNTNLQKFIATEEGKMCVGVISQFLDHFHLDYTTAVFGPEVNAGETIPAENDIRESLNLEPSEKLPLLSQLIQAAKSGRPSAHRLEGHQIQYLRSKFHDFDYTSSGSIDRKDVVTAISHACPSVNTDMVDKFVTHELKDVYTLSVTFDSFLNLFQKFYEMCTSVTMIGSQTNLLPLLNPHQSVDKNSNTHYLKQSTTFHQVHASPTPISEPEPSRIAPPADSSGIASAYLMPTSTHARDSGMDIGYDPFFDSQPEKDPGVVVGARGGVGDALYTDTPAISPNSSKASNDWPNKKFKTEESAGHQQYEEDDFHSEQSISEDIQDMGDDLLQSSEKDESLDLTEDRTVSEIPHADYMEDIRHG